MAEAIRGVESTDAHALRRYVDETWSASWKMVNGIRLWCIDRRSGKVMHRTPMTAT